MGRTQKPLTIGVTDLDLLNHPKLRELAEKGHWVVEIGAAYAVGNLGPDGKVVGGEVPFDLIIGPHAWYMDTDHLKYLDVALKAARKTRYAKEDK